MGELYDTIDGILDILKLSQGGGADYVRYSEARYFTALLQILPRRVERGTVYSYHGGTVGINNSEVILDDTEAVIALYDDCDAPWLSRAAFEQYMARLEGLMTYLSEGGDMIDLIRTGGGGEPYRDVCRAALRKLEQWPVAYVPLNGNSYHSAVATLHQVAGSGKVATRRFNRKTIEVSRVCN